MSGLYMLHINYSSIIIISEEKKQNKTLQLSISYFFSDILYQRSV